MESAIEDALSRYMAEAAARNLLQEALKGKTPETPAEWAALVEALKAKALEAEEGQEEETLEGQLAEFVDLESPDSRNNLASRLARLSGILGVWVKGKAGTESRAEVSIPFLDLEAAHRLLTGYNSFYVDLEEALLIVRNLGQGYVALLARKEANLGQLLQVLRRLLPKEEKR